MDQDAPTWYQVSPKITHPKLYAVNVKQHKGWKKTMKCQTKIWLEAVKTW